MGYAIFTARKLMLRNRINQINFRMMQLAQQQQTLADQAGRWERAISNTRAVFSSIGNMFQTGMNMMLNNKMMQMAQGGQVDMNQLGNLLNGVMASGGNNFMNSPVFTYMNAMNQMIEIQNQDRLRQVKDMENQIELQMKSLETQLKAAQAEMDQVEKAEGNEIKNSAPQFA